MNEKYLQEGMDLKRLFLCFLNKLGWILLATLAGVIAAILCYQAVRWMQMPVEYQVQSKLYITFGQDETGEVYQYYNGYTWNDLMYTEPILQKTMAGLSGYSEEEVIAATTAEILSDIRVLTITITGDTAQKVREIDLATNAALEQFATESKELVSIVPIKVTEPARIVWDDRTGRAALAGGILGLLLSLLVFAFYDSLQDGVYVAADCRKRYAVPYLGTLLQGEQLCQTELELNLQKFVNGKRAAVLAVAGDPVALPVSDMTSVLIPTNPMMDQAAFQKVKEEKAVILELPFGVACGKRTEQLLQFLEGQECNVAGILIIRADKRFLERYYGRNQTVRNGE